MEKIVSIIERIKQGVCKIEVEEEYAIAFLYKDSYLLSVGHIFENINSESHICAHFINGIKVNAELLYRIYDQKNGRDYSILKLSYAIKNTRSLPISLAKYTGGKIATIGSGEILKDFSSAEGEIVGEHIIDNEEYLIKICSGQLGQMGFSGAPIFSLEDCAVIAIQCEATINEIGAERDTILAFPLERLAEDAIAMKYIAEKKKVKASEYIENYLLPSFGRSLLCLEHSDNLDAYMRCIIVKLLPEKNERFTVFVAKNSNNTIVPAIRKHHATRKMRYGIVGGMIRANVPIIYDFVNDKCYQLDLGGTGRESAVLNKKNKGAREDRTALLVAPIRDDNGVIVGVLSFDFFPVQNPEKDIIRIINKNSSELGRVLYLSELYAQTISQLLLHDYTVDIDFLKAKPT